MGGTFQTAIYLHNRTPTDVLGGKAPIEVWEDKPLGNFLHIREWGTLAFKHVEQRDRAHKLAPRAVKRHLVGYNTKRIVLAVEPGGTYKITNSAEVSFREKATRDVVPSKEGPLPEPGRIIYQPGSEEEDKEDCLLYTSPSPRDRG